MENETLLIMLGVSLAIGMVWGLILKSKDDKKKEEAEAKKKHDVNLKRSRDFQEESWGRIRKAERLIEADHSIKTGHSDYDPKAEILKKAVEKRISTNTTARNRDSDDPITDAVILGTMMSLAADTPSSSSSSSYDSSSSSSSYDSGSSSGGSSDSGGGGGGCD